MCVCVFISQWQLILNLEKGRRGEVTRLYYNRTGSKSNAFCGVEVNMGVYVCVGGWSVCGSSILSHSHPLLSFYGFVHYLFVHSLWLL